MAQADRDGAPDWPTIARVFRRYSDGWEPYNDHGTLCWWSEFLPGFDDELTDAEIAVLREAERREPGSVKVRGVPEIPANRS